MSEIDENIALAEPTASDLLAMDIDFRLVDLWRELDTITEWNLEIAAAFVRAAYGKGYQDSMEEPHGKLHADNGYTVPPKPAHKS